MESPRVFRPVRGRARLVAHLATPSCSTQVSDAVSALLKHCWRRSYRLKAYRSAGRMPALRQAYSVWSHSSGASLMRRARARFPASAHIVERIRQKDAFGKGFEEMVALLDSNAKCVSADWPALGDSREWCQWDQAAAGPVCLKFCGILE